MNFIKLNNRFTFFLSVFWLFLMLFDIGFVQSHEIQSLVSNVYIGLNLIFLANITFRVQKSFLGKDKSKKYGQLFLGLLGFLIFIIQISNLLGYHILGGEEVHRILLSVFVIFLFFEEFSNSLYEIKVPLHPAGIFVVSFLLIIFFGALLLMLPRSTRNGISFIDALFTSTSAVCVTGLASLDVSKEFTRLGQSFILFLIQVGGLGILTYTSLFGLMFTNQSSFHNQLMVKDMISATSISNTFSSLIRIILFTVVIEFVGAVIIYLSIGHQYFSDEGSKIFFAVFHAVSGFCNAGFSTLSNNLYEDTVRFNYALHITVAFLIILGGIGFLILSSYANYIRDWVIYRYKKFQGERARNVVRPIVTLNTKIVMVTTTILLTVGTVFFFVSEFNGVLKDHEWYGKWVEAFFLSVSPRTAGFNTVNMGMLTYPTILFTIFLMWVGASPGSTGGGIKTSTFAIATLNIYHQVLGRSRMTIGWKEIPQGSILKAFAIICLSFIICGLCTLLVGIFDPHLNAMQACFEAFSAYGTVGLSLNITPTLSSESKYVLVVTMILGRVGALTMITAIFYSLVQVKTPRHQYPQEEVFIN